MSLATYTVWFTEKTTYRLPVQASSPIEAARLVNAQWRDEGTESLEPQGTEVGDFAVYDADHQGHDFDADDLDEEGTA